MSAIRALVVDGDEVFADRLRGWLAASDLEVQVSAEWNDGLVTEASPSIVFVAVELPEKAGLACCERVRALRPGVPIVLTTGTVPQAEMDQHRGTGPDMHTCLDKHTLTREEIHATLEALIGTLLGRGQEPEGGASGRLVELEEEIRRLRWELDETRRAAQSVPYSRDFMRMSEVVSTKEKEIVRLKKEIAARDHKIATAQRTQREASARALVATREREAATGHAGQLEKDLETEQSEVRRLRLEVQRQGAEAEKALASLIDERQQHDETRRQAEITLAAQLEARSALETQLREEKDQAVAGAVAEWRGRLKRRRRRSSRAVAALNARLGELQSAHHQELAAAQAEAEARREEEIQTARAAGEGQREELQRLHELSLAEALCAQADAERRAEQHRSALGAAEARLQEEKTQAVASAVAEWQRKLEELRRAHADSVDALRRHFLDQLEGAQVSLKQERTQRDGETEASLLRAGDELRTARAEAAQLDVETRQRYEEALVQSQARHLEALTALETRLREEKARAVAASAAEWEAKLEELRRAHADSTEALRRRHVEELGALQVSGSRELAAAGAQTLLAGQQIRERHELELADVRAGQLEALASLEARLREEKEQAVAASVAVWQGQLEELRRGHDASLEALSRRYRDEIASLRKSHELARAELVRLHDLALAGAQAGHVEAERRAEQEHRSAQVAFEERLHEEHARARATAASEWESRLDELRRGHAGSLEALRQYFQDQLAELRASVALERGERDGEHQAALRRAAEELASARTQFAHLDQETRQRYVQELGRAETRHLEALRALEARLREERDQAVAAAVTAWEGKLEELRLSHAASVEALQQEHQRQVAALAAAREQELRQKDDEQEAALRRLGEELAVVRSKAAQPGPAQLVARHAEALKALEARLLEEKDRSVAAAVAEWKAKMERLRRGHADAMAALRREHEDQLLALDAARQEATATRTPSDQAARVVPLKAVNRDRSS